MLVSLSGCAHLTPSYHGEPEGELDLSDFVMEEDAEMCAAARIPVSGPSTVPNSVQQRIESALSSVPGLQASNVTVKVCVITNNYGSVKF